MKKLLSQISTSLTQPNLWNLSGRRWFGVGLSVLGIWIIGHFGSWPVAVGVFLWQWGANIDHSDL